MKTILVCLILSCSITFKLEAMKHHNKHRATYTSVIINGKQQTDNPYTQDKQIIQKNSNGPDYKKLYLELKFSELVHPCFMMLLRQNEYNFTEYQKLLDLGLDINFSHPCGNTTLTKSCIEGCADIEVTKWLIAQGANINLLNTYKQNAAMFTAMDTFGIRTNLFIYRPELTIDQQDSNGNTLLLYLLSKPSAWYFVPSETYKKLTLKQIAVLLNRNANPRLANKDGLTPLQAAQRTQDQRAIQLIENALKQEKTT